MDPRQQPQHPFSRNTASPYGRNQFSPSSNQPPYPPSSHPPAAAPSYADHQRRPSDPPYNFQQRNYGPESGSAHSRHHSSSSIGHGTPVSRGMPPPSSPQQQTPQHSYGPPPPRAPPVSVGPPTAFPGGRELPALNSLGRPGGNGMSISSILGGPAPASREPFSQGMSPIPVSTSVPGVSMYSVPAHASPRTATAGPDYAPFRRPQTPEHQRSYDPRDRANSAGSPPGVGQYTPDARRYGNTPSYSQRQQPPEERREPIRVPNPNAMPPRPTSQPAFNPPRPADARAPIHTESIFGARREAARELGRDPAYQRNEYEGRQDPYAYAAERERARHMQEREAAVQREREQRERAHNEHTSSMAQEYAHHMAQRNPQVYSRPPEQREQPAWMRPGYEPPRPPPYEPIPEQEPHRREPLNDFPRTSAPQYGGHAAYANEHRYPAATHAQSQPQQAPVSQYEASIQERQRHALELQQQQQRQQAAYGGSQNPQYQSQESPTRRTIEDAQQMQQQMQRTFLGVQEMNRKGRVSPLPQAVQGAQAQMGGPGGEPGIKSEFGRMFSGIGSGVGAMGAPSPVAGAQGLPTPGQLRREDLEGLQGESPVENGGYKIARSSSRGGGRRRKLKEEDGKDDDSSTGRRTPSGRGKRPKTHHHHSHHHHIHHQNEPTSSPSQTNLTPFKSVKGSSVPTPPSPKSLTATNAILHHHHIPRHHHHSTTPTKPVLVPLPKTMIRSSAVLDSVSHLPRNHLGHEYYEADLKPTSSVKRGRRGFASTPHPLPRFEGMENCTFTVRIPRIYLEGEARREITYRRAVWGTDVYTDDSDVIAACIHQGWFRGEWDEDIDTSLLGLELEDVPPEPYTDVLTAPPASGPMKVPAGKECHVTVLVLPALEKYSSVTRFGLKSREWGGERKRGFVGHDGLSFSILKVEWVAGVDAGERGRGMRRRKLLEDEMSAEREEMAFFDSLESQNQEGGESGGFETSFERGGPIVDIKGVGMGSWWRKSEKEKRVAKGTPPRVLEIEDVQDDGRVDGVVEREVERDVADALVESARLVKEEVVSEESEKSIIERVTRRMIENANRGATKRMQEEAGREAGRMARAGLFIRHD